MLGDGMSSRSLSLVFASASAVICVALQTRADSSPAPAALTSQALRGTRSTLARSEQLWTSVGNHGRDLRPAYLARFSDGPRSVPRARGAARARAAQLGIGTTDQARQLLREPPSPQLVAAVRGETPRTLLWPVVRGRFGRGFGFTRRVRPELPHNGVDIGARAGTVVRAVADGLVVYSDNGLLGFGNCVMILHRNGWLSLYAHQRQTTVQPGLYVSRGERIGLVGQTGYAWGPHLHFELRDNGRLRDPERLFVGQRSDEVNGPMVALETAPAAQRSQPAFERSAPREDAQPTARATRSAPRAGRAVNTGGGLARHATDVAAVRSNAVAPAAAARNARARRPRVQVAGHPRALARGR